MSRIYRLLDFTIAHKQLVYRAVGDNDHDANDDFIFGGVEYMNLPTTVLDMRVRGRGPAGGNPTTPIPISDPNIHIFDVSGLLTDGKSFQGLIAARDYRRESNSRDLGDSGLRNVSPSQIVSSFDFEKRLLSELSSIGAYRTIIPAASSGADAVVETSGGQRVLVEAKWFQGRPLRTLIRSTVMQVVVMIDRFEMVSGVLIVLGGADSDSSNELSRHLTTALSGRPVKFKVLNWEPANGVGPLTDAVRDLT